MKALTLIQPWASLLIRGYKVYETRPWSTIHRGRLVITASKRFPDASNYPPLKNPSPRLPSVNTSDDFFPPPLGKAIGQIELVEVKKPEDTAGKLAPIEIALGDFTAGRYAWEFRPPRPFAKP